MDSSATPQDTLLHKALWYSAAAAGVAGLVAPTADAQVVYTDPEPDVIIQDTEDFSASDGLLIGSYRIDFDGDGDAELTLGEDSNARSYVIAQVSDFDGDEPEDADDFTGGIGRLLPFGGVDYLYPYGLDAGASVGPTKTMLDGGLATFTFGSSDPNSHIGAGDRYAGFRFELDNGDIHYAWLRFEMPEAGQLILKDYAFEATPETAITAGDVGVVAVDPDALEDGYLFSEVRPNPVAGRSSFELTVGQAETVSVDLFDALGRRAASLYTGAMAPGATQTVEMSAADLPAGVYVIRVTGESFVTTRNVTIVR